MRTTLSIDDKVLDEVRQQAEAGGDSIGQSVSELLRRALTAEARPIEYPNGFKPLPSRAGHPRMTLELVNALWDGNP